MTEEIDNINDSEKRLDRLNRSIDKTIERVAQLEKEVAYLFKRIQQAECISRRGEVRVSPL